LKGWIIGSRRHGVVVDRIAGKDAIESHARLALVWISLRRAWTNCKSPYTVRIRPVCYPPEMFLGGKRLSPSSELPLVEKLKFE
jgi:hypothetical protein